MLVKIAKYGQNWRSVSLTLDWLNLANRIASPRHRATYLRTRVDPLYQEGGTVGESCSKVSYQYIQFEGGLERAGQLICILYCLKRMNEEVGGAIFAICYCG